MGNTNIFARLGRKLFQTSHSESRRYLSYIAVLFLLCLCLSAFKLSTSSLPFSSDGKDDAPILVNKVRMTRSDDFLRGVPRWISYARGGKPDSILDYSQSDQFVDDQDTPVSFVLDKILILPDEAVQDAMTRVMPLEIQFSMREWFVYLRAFTVIPLFFLLFGYRIRLGVIASIIVAFTPLSLWFGGSALAMLSAVLLPICLIRMFVSVYESDARQRFILLFVLGIYSGKTVFGAIDYPPWKWPMLLVFGTFAVAHTIRTLGIGRLVRPLVLVGGVILAIQGGRWFSYHNQYAVTLDTVYPGKRRATGGGGYGNPMAGAISWFMQTNESSSKGMVNPEFAFSLNALIWPCILSIPVLVTRRERSAKTSGFVASMFPLGLLLLWVSTKWPPALLNYNPLTFVTTDRAGQILGVIAILLFVLSVDMRVEGDTRTKVVLGAVSGVFVFVLSVNDANYWNDYFYGSRPVALVWTSVLLLSVAVGLFYVLRNPAVALLPIVIFSVASSFRVQPLTVGLGPLTNSELASSIRELVKGDPEALWGSDPFWGDALTISQGARMVSGQQPLGPNKKLWAKLDPGGNYVEKWNRGQSYIHFIWDQNEPGIRISNPSPDVISVVIAPCGPVMKSFGLKYLMTKETPGQCAHKLFSGTWMTNPVGVYELSG